MPHPHPKTNRVPPGSYIYVRYILNICTFLCQQSRQGEEWFKIRRILNMKMLKTKVVGEYSQQLNDVATDLLSHMKKTRDPNGIVPSIQQQLFKWSLECELIGSHVSLSRRCNLSSKTGSVVTLQKNVEVRIGVKPFPLLKQTRKENTERKYVIV